MTVIVCGRPEGLAHCPRCDPEDGCYCGSIYFHEHCDPTVCATAAAGMDFRDRYYEELKGQYWS